ncbi:hypothetical protein [Azospirillum endophyticum]
MMTPAGVRGPSASFPAGADGAESGSLQPDGQTHAVPR